MLQVLIRFKPAWEPHHRVDQQCQDKDCHLVVRLGQGKQKLVLDRQ